MSLLNTITQKWTHHFSDKSHQRCAVEKMYETAMSSTQQYYSFSEVQVDQHHVK